MSLVEELREIVDVVMSEKSKVSFVDVIARFDWQWHAIPTLNEFKQALKKLDKFYVTKDSKGVLQISSNSDERMPSCEITQDDLTMVYDIYVKRVKQISSTVK